MKKIFLLVLSVSVLLSLAGCLTSSASSVIEPKFGTIDTPVDKLSSPSLALRVNGNKIFNERGEEVRLAGVNICSLEWKYTGDNVSASMYEVFANWNCNLVRLPLSQDYWFGKVVNWSTPNPSDGGAQYKKIVDQLVELALSFGKYIELDLHWSNAGEWGKNIGQHNMPDENSVEFWVDVAKRYANNPAVLFNLYNEPHDITWEVWRNGGSITEVVNKGKSDEKTLTYVTPGHQKIVNEIRKAGANNIIIAGGLDWAYDLTGVASYALTDTPQGNGIVYDSHIYPWKEWNGRNHDTKVLSIADKYPVIVGEIGIDLFGEWGAFENFSGWLKGMLDWFDKNELHWTAWCFHKDATPNMISDWSFTPTKHHGAVVKERLLSYPDTNAHLDSLPNKPR
jgi:hypothetical protein